MMKFHLFVLLLVVALLGTGCGVDNHEVTAAPGDVKKFGGLNYCWFSTGFLFYIKPPDKLNKLIESSASWSVPNGLILEDTRVRVKPVTVSTSKGPGDTYYTAEGFEIYAYAKLRVTSDCTPGRKVVSLKLPVLAEAASTLNASTECVEEFSMKFSPPDTFEVGVVNIQAR